MAIRHDLIGQVDAVRIFLDRYEDGVQYPLYMLVNYKARRECMVSSHLAHGLMRDGVPVSVVLKDEKRPGVVNETKPCPLMVRILSRLHAPHRG